MISLRRKLAGQMAALVLCIIVLGAAALAGLSGLRSDFSSALAAHHRLRNLYEVGLHVQSARIFLNLNPPEIGHAKSELERAGDTIEVDPLPDSMDESVLRDALAAAARSDSPDSAALDAILAPMIRLDAQNRQLIQDAQNRADARWKSTMIGMSVLLAAAALGATAIGVAQYRLVIYRALERLVDEKSAQLVRSQRLAGVGLLAAGVAHEINNPLGIITAHAELSLNALGKNPDEEPAKTLAIICEEAFRCKRIVEKLLTLSRAPDEPPKNFSMGKLARQIVENTGKMPEFRDKRIVAQIPAGEDEINGRADEITQVILNLLVNALEATPAGGEVRVEISRRDGGVELSVTDSGAGIASPMLERIFEPFVTDPGGKADVASGRGTGLGLSIAQAIVMRHGGELRATSAGRYMGSTFVVTLPWAWEQVKG